MKRTSNASDSVSNQAIKTKKTKKNHSAKATVTQNHIKVNTKISVKIETENSTETVNIPRVW